MTRLLIFGPGYTAGRLAARLEQDGWTVDRVGRESLPDAEAVSARLAQASHLLSSVPPDRTGEDPVLGRYAAMIERSSLRWIGYLSSTGVYGDADGAWVDEGAPLLGRRSGRIAADAAWLRLGARVFRLPGIYGPGRSMLDRARAGQVHRVDLPRQVFSRIHVDDIVSGVIASLTAGPPGAYNLADHHPASQNSVVETACALLGIAPPPVTSLEAAGLSPAARAFYAENRRVANGRARRLLDWLPRHGDWRCGLAAILSAEAH